MKKWISVLLVLAVLLFVSAASAENHPVNPYAAEARNPVYHAPEESGMSVELTGPAAVMVGRDAEWRISVSGGEAPYSYQYYILNPDGETNSYRHWSQSDTFAFDFVQKGEYILLANVRDNAENIASVRLEISVAPDPVAAFANTATTVAEKVTQLVNECYTKVDRNDQYAVALWLHDWVVDNAYYDFTYNATYCYDPEGVLLRGTGVCDSYAKAYVLLLEKAGISAKRIVNYDHAWVGARIDGDWYHIDPTWDDPGDVPLPKSGDETHNYFCVPDEILALDHDPWMSYNVTDYHSYAANYDIHSGVLKNRLDENSEIVEYYTGMGFVFNIPNFYTYADIGAALQRATQYPLELAIGNRQLYSYYDDEFLLMYRINARMGYLLAYLMSGQPYSSGDSEMYCKVTYDPNRHSLLFTPDESRVFIPEALVTTSNTVMLGQSVTYTFKYAGQDPIEGMEYHVYNKYGQHISGWTGISDTYTFTPDAVGRYTVRVYVKTRHNDWMAVDSEVLTVTAPADALRITALTPNKASALLGEQLTFTTEMTGSSKITFMEYHIYNEYGQHITGYTGISDYYSFTPTAPGTYTARVYMRTNHSDEVDLICDSAPVTVKGGERTLKALRPASTTAKVGDTLTFTTEFEGSGAIAWIEYHIYDTQGNHLTGYRGEGDGISGVYHYDTRSTGAGRYTARVYLMTMDGYFAYVDSEPVMVTAAVTAIRPTQQEADTQSEEPEEEPAGSSFETAIEAGRSIRAELETATYYRVKLAEGTYTFTLRDTVTEAGDGAELAVYSKSQSSLMKLRTAEGEAVGQLTVPGGEYYLVLSGAGVELLIEEAAEEPAVEPAEALAEETAEESAEASAAEVIAEEPVAGAVEAPAEQSGAQSVEETAAPAEAESGPLEDAA